MGMIRAGFRVEGRLQIDDLSTKAGYHLRNHVIGADAQSPGPTHQRFQNQIITLFRSDTLLRNVTPPSNDLDLADLPNG